MSTITNAQSKKERNLLNVANKEYNNLRFSYSIPFYKKYLTLYPNDTLALKNIAYAYRNVNQYDSALKYLEKAVSFGHLSNYILPELYATLNSGAGYLSNKSTSHHNKIKMPSAKKIIVGSLSRYHRRHDGAGGSQEGENGRIGAVLPGHFLALSSWCRATE